MKTPPPILLTSKALAKFDFGDLLNHIIDFKNFQLPTYRIIVHHILKNLTFNKKHKEPKNLMTTPPPILLTNTVLAKFDFGDLLNHMIKTPV